MIQSPISSLRVSDSDSFPFSASAAMAYGPKEAVEQIFSEIVFKDYWGKSGAFDSSAFCSYLNPNENPEGYRSILNEITPLCQDRPGLIMSVGTERILFLLLLVDERYFTGVLGRDRDPAAKAYLDFVFLLIRLSSSMEEFVQLALPPTSDLLPRRIAEIRDKISVSSISLLARDYYLEHLELFSSIYYDTNKNWVDWPEMDCVNYWRNRTLFDKLKRYVDAGAAASTVGDLRDPLPAHYISLIDESNCRYWMKAPYPPIPYQPAFSVPLPRAIIRTIAPFFSGGPNWVYKWSPF